jgi:hypothetical protein
MFRAGKLRMWKQWVLFFAGPVHVVANLLETKQIIQLSRAPYRSGAKYCTIVQYLLLFHTIFEALEGPIHGENEIETSNCN